MSTAADNLLDGIMTAAEDGQPTDDRIILSVDEPSRTINYDGNLILGVKGDRFAERIYFRCPQYVYKDVSEFIDLEKPTTIIKINYKNAYNEPYIEECVKHGLENGEFIFSWFISDWATVKDGVVTFNVCVVDESETLTDKNGNVIVQEWHSTTFKGTILPAIDVSDVTPEVYTSDTKTSKAIIDEIEELKGIVYEYEQLVDTKVEDATDVYFSETTIDLYNKFEDYKTEANEYIDGELNKHVDEVKAEIQEWDKSYVISVLTEPGPDNSINYVNTFDFSTLDVSNIEKYVCVIDGEPSVVLPITKWSVTSGLTQLFFDNSKQAIQILYYPNDKRVTIMPIDATSSIAQKIYQYAAEDDNLYDGEYPLLISGHEGYIDEVTSSEVLAASNILANPIHGSISANSFVENGTLLSDKYALKDESQNNLKEYTLTMAADGELLNETSGSVRMKYPFELRHDTVINVFPKAKYIQIINPGEDRVYTFSVKGFNKHYNSINNYHMNISGSLYYDDECNEFSVFIGYHRTGETTYDNHLVMRVPSNSYQSNQYIFPTLYNSQDPGHNARVVILYEE